MVWPHQRKMTDSFPSQVFRITPFSADIPTASRPSCIGWEIGAFSKLYSRTVVSDLELGVFSYAGSFKDWVSRLIHNDVAVRKIGIVKTVQPHVINSDFGRE